MGVNEIMNEITKYLELEKRLSKFRTREQLEKISRYPDILNEFKHWLANREYNAKKPIVIEGYTAKDIFELAPFLDGIGVYDFLITLREHPERGHKTISDGFKIK